LDAFLSDAQVHYSIIEAIARGERTWQGVTKRVGRDGGSLSRAVHWLIGMRLLDRVVPITETNPDRSKRAIYRITDPYLAFWHRFVSPMLSAGMIGLTPPEELWEHRVAPRFDDHMGAVFEDACRSFVRRGRGLPFAPVRVGEWWDARSENEVDIVAVGAAGELLLAESKWGVPREADLARLEARADLLVRELSGVRWVYFALFSGRGLHPDLVASVKAGRVLHFSLESLYVR
jgi:AAA+ ATPase superfamily predicted ATPase